MTPFVAWHFDWFVQDSWKVTRKLNVEAGVRYSLWPPWQSRWNTLAMFHPDFYNPGRASLVDPRGGFIVSGDRYNGIVMPGGGPLESAVSRFPFLRDFTQLYHGLPRGFSKTHKGGFQPRRSCARSSPGKSLTDLPITAGAAWAGTAFVTAPTASASFVR